MAAWYSINRLSINKSAPARWQAGALKRALHLQFKVNSASFQQEEKADSDFLPARKAPTRLYVSPE
jgi:hypothetical protein